MKHPLQFLEHHHGEECGCGHEHHHEEECGRGHEHHHEGGCSCGHDHEHHHEGGCGCGHGHEHHHEGGCGCGHEHHHEEGCGCGHGHHHEDGDICRQNQEGSGNKHIYILENLGCAHCAAKMEEKIGKLPGIASATITYTTKQLCIWAEHPEGYLEQVKEICTSIEPDVKVREKDGLTGGKELAPRHNGNKRGENADSGKRKEKTGLACILVGTVLFFAGVILEFMESGIETTLPVYIAAYVLLGAEIVWTAFRNLTKGHIFDENFLMSVATLGAFAIAEYPEAVGVMLFYRIGEFFEHKAVEKSRRQIMEAVDMRPEIVNLETETGIQVIGAGEAQVGDILLVRPGDRIPLDGVVVEGKSRIDTSPITGEPVPVRRETGDAVISGCVNTSGQLKIRVEKALKESMVTKILDSVENAAASKPKMDRFITRFAKIYTPLVVMAAVVIAVVPSVVTGDWNYWIYTALSFLVMSCPCALVLSVPLAFFSGIGAGSREGILFKGGASIEAMSVIKAVVMDKTGTITEGDFVVQKVVPEKEGNLTETALLALCAGCEQYSTHPIAASIVAKAKAEGLDVAEPDRMEEIAGHGIRAYVKGKEILCGNQKLMDKFGVSMEKTESKSLGSEVCIAVDGIYSGRILVADTIKADAKSACQELKKMNVAAAMLTGDRPESAEIVAREIGLSEFRAKLLPEDKLSGLMELRKKYGSVMFVGDGINDAPVLAGADVGAAMGSGADAAIEAADVVFMTSSMEAVPRSLRIARHTRRISWQNVAFALVVKAAVMVLGLCGFASMWAAVFADSGVAMLCVLNSIRILYRRPSRAHTFRPA